MSTFLELVESLSQEVDEASNPTTVVGQAGADLQKVNWVKQAYIELQNRADWNWLRHDFTLVTSTSDDSYAYTDCTDVTSAVAIDRFSRFVLNDRQNPPRIYNTASGVGNETWMIWMEWDEFRHIYKIGTQNDGAPVHITVDPQDNIRIGPAPNGSYTITGEFFRSPQILDVTNDSDTPEMPVQFHQLIVYQAMKKYAGMYSAPEVMQRAHDEGRPMLRRLEVNQRPRTRLAGPMA